ncbi:MULTISPECIES: DUF1003 domain-containing protein [Phenylobacterium]|uniref:Membrane protein n=1 Tax=Phenylobacterium koreense TaxID=266125 RepID=A0ABV2EH60_9CAUL
MSDLPHDIGKAAHHWFGKPISELSAHQQRALNRAMTRKPISKNINDAFQDRLTFGQRLADQVATFGGSWTFIIAFGLALAIWVGGNLLLRRAAFDPYPFIFLNLMLSMLAAVQAPIIMMSQNRQAAKDRLDAAHDYEVNLKCEIEIMALHDKLDQMRNEQLQMLVAKQEEQIELLTRLLAERLPRA